MAQSEGVKGLGYYSLGSERCPLRMDFDFNGAFTNSRVHNLHGDDRGHVGARLVASERVTEMAPAEADRACLRWC